jgi:ribosomal protein L36
MTGSSVLHSFEQVDRPVVKETVQCWVIRRRTVLRVIRNDAIRNDISISTNELSLKVVINENKLPGSAVCSNSFNFCAIRNVRCFEGTPVYIDADHVSYDWPAHVIRALGEILEPYLKSL